MDKIASDDKGGKSPKKTEFNQNLRKAGFFSRQLFTYAWPLISKIIDNGGVMKEEMLEDMTTEDNET